MTDIIRQLLFFFFFSKASQELCAETHPSLPRTFPFEQPIACPAQHPYPKVLHLTKEENIGQDEIQRAVPQGLGTYVVTCPLPSQTMYSEQVVRIHPSSSCSFCHEFGRQDFSQWLVAEWDLLGQDVAQKPGRAGSEGFLVTFRSPMPCCF